MLVGSTSFALHGVTLAVVVAIVGERMEARPHEHEPTAIEVVSAAPHAPPQVARRAQPVPPAATPSPSAATRTRRAQVPRAVEPSTPAATQSLADLTIGYDDPTNFAEHAAKPVEGSVARRSGIRTGVDHQSGDGVATMQLPQPPVVSRARPPRPKLDYTRLRLIGASQFAGHTIKVLLVVDPRGHVREVQLLEGVDRALDRRTVALVHNFEFEPALDDEGVAVRGTQRWDIQIVEDEDDDTFKTGLQRHL
jgi:hypothetical protein